jgi:hypothetical protein
MITDEHASVKQKPMLDSLRPSQLNYLENLDNRFQPLWEPILPCSMKWTQNIHELAMPQLESKGPIQKNLNKTVKQPLYPRIGVKQEHLSQENLFRNIQSLTTCHISKFLGSVQIYTDLDSAPYVQLGPY